MFVEVGQLVGTQHGQTLRAKAMFEQIGPHVVQLREIDVRARPGFEDVGDAQYASDRTPPWVSLITTWCVIDDDADGHSE